MPRRKILLSVGANNYRPPMERSKSAPKLMAIEEAIGEEDEDVESVPNTAEARQSCCNVDPLFPAMTLGRRHCRRGHSIRRSRLNLSTGSTKNLSNTVPRERERSRSVSFNDFTNTIIADSDVFGRNVNSLDDGQEDAVEIRGARDSAASRVEAPKRRSQTESQLAINSMEEDDDEDFNNLLMVNKYDTKSSFSGEFMSYFDSKIKLKTAASLSDLSPLQFDNEVSMAANTTLIGQRASVSLDDLDTLTDGEDDDDHGDTCTNFQLQRVCDNDDDDDTNDALYSQDSILDCLINASAGQMNERPSNTSTRVEGEFDERECFGTKSEGRCDSFSSKNDDRFIQTRNPAIAQSGTMKRPFGATGLDSDEGSISSGCETSSTMTANNFDATEKEQGHQRDAASILTLFASKNGSSATIVRMDGNEGGHMILDCGHDECKTGKCTNGGNLNSSLRANNNHIINHDDDCDSEFSDESGFVEYQHNSGKNVFNAAVNILDGGDRPVISDKKNDSNNNTTTENNEFSASDKVPTRLMINIPKNAKSILI